MSIGQFLLVLAGIVLGYLGVRAITSESVEDRCKDGADTKAYMARAPGKSHDTEKCIQVMRYGDPRWVPELNNPLTPGKFDARH